MVVPPNGNFAAHEEAAPIDYNEDFRSAIERGNRAEVQHLIAEGHIEVNIEYLGMTPLSMACQAGHIDIVQDLIDGGAQINFQPIVLYGETQRETQLDCSTPLIAAATYGHAAIVTLLLNSGANKEAVADLTMWMTGGTALHGAVYLGKLLAVNALLEKGVNVNAIGKGYYSDGAVVEKRVGTAIEIAVFPKVDFNAEFSVPLPEQIAIVQALMRAGADDAAIERALQIVRDNHMDVELERVLSERDVGFAASPAAGILA